MKRVTVNALVDIGSVIALIPSLLTGLVLYIFLPSGGGRGGSWVTFLGITRHEWVLWHDISSFAFAALILIHLLLHWRFYKNIKKAFGPWAKDTCAQDE